MNICGDCRRFMGCSWERSFIPVEGWVATKTKISYNITYCPLYIPPESRNPTERQKRKEGLVFGTNMKTGETKTWRNYDETAKDGFTPIHVNLCCNGKERQHKGWTFRREESR